MRHKDSIPAKSHTINGKKKNRNYKLETHKYSICLGLTTK